VILNLIVNAIEAMSGQNEAPRELLIGSEKADPDGVLVAVRDSGPGLALENLDRLFEAFYTTKASGMGMGLSICRSIVEAHGGLVGERERAPRRRPSIHRPYLRGRRVMNPSDQRRGIHGSDPSPAAAPYPAGGSGHGRISAERMSS